MQLILLYLLSVLLFVPTVANATSVTQDLSITVTAAAPPSPGPLYGEWANFPQSDTFFPIAIWQGNPNRGLPGTGYPDVATAAKAVGINIIWAVDNGGVAWPTGVCSGDSNGYLAKIKATSLYLMPDITIANNTARNSISSISCLAASLGATSNIIAWNMGDEPQTGTCTTWPMSAIPGQVATIEQYDTTRPLLLNSTDFIFGGGVCPGNTAYIQAIHISSFDLYPTISPWLPRYTSAPNDALWAQGWSVDQFRSIGGETKPHWAFLESGSDALGFASQNGNNCPGGDAAGVLCSNGSYKHPPLELVNAEAWNSIINGANGIAWFCHDLTAIAWCLGEGATPAALAARDNIKYINETVLSFAQQLNAPTVGLCTMITDNTFAAHVNTCSDGIVTVSTGTSSIPGGAMVKSFQGTHYLFAQPNRNGQTAFTFTLNGDAGKMATVVYDSNAHYDPAHSSVGAATVLNGSDQFTDTFGANGRNYQVRIYRIQ